MKMFLISIEGVRDFVFLISIYQMQRNSTLCYLLVPIIRRDIILFKKKTLNRGKLGVSTNLHSAYTGVDFSPKSGF